MRFLTARRARAQVALAPRLAPLLGLLLGLCARALDAQSAMRTAVTDTVVVDCRIGEVAAQVLEGRMHGDTLFLPTARLLALAGLDSGGTRGDRSLESSSMLLHADVVFDPGALVVQFADSGTLPVSRRAARSRMRALLRERALVSRSVAVPARVSSAPSALALSYAAQRDGAFAVDAVSRAAGGALQGSLTHAPGGTMHATLGWTRIPDDARGGTRIRLGALDELSGATGVLVTNVPLLRDDTLRALVVTAPAAPGTELELFDDDELVAADSVAGASTSRLVHPQRYGAHVVRLVTHDANGGEHESRWIESTPDALLPRGTLRYTAAAGRCTPRTCSSFIGSVAYAPTDRVTLTLAAGPAMTRATAAASRPHDLRASLDARLADASVLSLRREGSDLPSAELRVDRGVGRTFVLTSGTVGSALASALVPAPRDTRRRLSSLSGSWLLPAHGVLDAASALSRTSVAVATNVSVPLRVGVVQGSVAVLRDGGDACVGWTFGALVTGAWMARVIRRLRSALLRLREERRASPCGTTSLGVTTRSATTHSALLALPTGPTSALELSASWERARRPVLSVALRRRIGSILTAHAQLTGDDRSYAARSDVAGTVVLDALRRSISLAADPGPSSATVEGVVYVDANANGRRDVGDEVVAGAVVRSGDASAVSDADGIFVLSALSADRLARLSVDSVSVEDAGVVPAAPVSVVLTPRAVVRVDIALRRPYGSAP